MLMALVMAAAVQGTPAASAPTERMQVVQVSVQGVVNGRTVIDCQRTADGALQDCQVAEELPKARGFGKAGLNLVGKMKLDPGAPSRIAIPITFTAEETPENLVRDPKWRLEPVGEDFSRAYPPKAKTSGQGDLNCMVTDKGGLTDCIVTDVAPLGAGFGEAILMLAPRYRMEPLGKNGAPVAGRPIKIPIRFIVE